MLLAACMYGFFLKRSCDLVRHTGLKQKQDNKHEGVILASI